MAGAAAEQNGTSKKEDNFTNLYVKCFPQSYTEENLCELFGGCGPINAAKVMSDARGRKFAFISFERHDDAHNCIKEMHRKDLRTRKEQKAAAKLEAEGKGEPVICDADGHPEHLLYVGRAQTKAERQAMLESQYGPKGSTKGSSKGKGRGGGTVYYGPNGETTNGNPMTQQNVSSAVPSMSSGATARPANGGATSQLAASMAPSVRDVPGAAVFSQSQRQQQRPQHQQQMPYMAYSYGDGGSNYSAGHDGSTPYGMNGTYAANYDNGYGGGGCYSEWGDGYGCEGTYAGVGSYHQQQHQSQQQQQQYWAL